MEGDNLVYLTSKKKTGPLPCLLASSTVRGLYSGVTILIRERRGLLTCGMFHATAD